MSGRDDIKKQIRKQDDEIYGENTIAGSSPDPESDDDTTGPDSNYATKVKPGDDFYLADEVLSDDKVSTPNAYSPGSEEEEEEEEEI